MRYFLFLCITLFPLAAFAETTPAELLSGEQKTYYENSFNYAMNKAKANKPYHWKTQNAKGAILAGEKFVSKSKATCRNYAESFVVETTSDTGKGIACKRDANKGWCRLKDGDALTCALENSGGFLGDVGAHVNKAKNWLGF